jgi:hypothetical protein
MTASTTEQNNHQQPVQSGKTWSHKIYVGAAYFGEFVIKSEGEDYELFFYEQFGDVVRLYSAKLEELWSCLLTTKRVKTENTTYEIDVSKLDIPTDLNEWTVR